MGKNFIKKWRRKLAIWLLHDQAALPDEIIPMLTTHQEFSLPMGSNVHEIALFYNSISAYILNLLVYNNKIIKITKTISPINADTIVHIIYMTDSDFSNMIQLAYKEVEKNASID